MYVCINDTDFNKHFVMLSNKTPNNIIDNSDFYRIYYSDKIHNSNGIYIFFTLKNGTISKYFNKLKCSFDSNQNKRLITSFANIERQILYLYPDIFKSQPTFRIGEQLDNHFIKIFVENGCVPVGKFQSSNFILKISGIWSNNKKYGLTFRFYIANHLLRNDE